MKHYCITGGIGAGKSYVCKLLKQHGIDIYDCDAGAKRLMNGSPELICQLTELIGEDAYCDGKLNKPVVAQFLLQSEANKLALNAVVHPAVMKDFYASGLQWMESAILHEAHLEHWVDGVVAVTAPTEVRISRVMARDGLSHDKAAAWVAAQIDQQIVEQRSDFIIVNDGTTPLEPQVEKLLERFPI